ncbi:AAA family ATPase [Acidianus sulfidivorans JP7]|uniref:AAA family ATPase n=1 Tax=Acidianus sulfidivorans JP7 TaxID=619593 RepID=A0A2U9IQ38_9CREN|nr:ATP-binding protein [Acidianus sulfidivorans]AWR98168.1 AAA family ATPase [Acidianus sulfidivorans JP7]
MNVEELKGVIVDQREMLEEKKNLIERDTPDLLKYLRVPNILAILGVRRAGKSTLSTLLLRGQKIKFAYVNFDDERLFGMEAKDLKELEKAIYEVYGEVEYMIFDEIQNVKGWELFASRLRETKKVIITGGNSKVLSGELATYLTGRHSDYILFTFSFKEYLRLKGINVAKEDFYSTRRLATLKVELEKYMDIGGFPEALILGKEQINVIYNDILFKDIMSRYKIREIGDFKEFARTVISYYSNEISLSAIAKVLNVNKKSVEIWANGLREAYLTFFIPRYGEKLKQRLTYNKKVYVVDPGIISSLAIKGKDKGRIMENIVAIKLLRDLQSEEHLYYIRNKFEVDFYDEINSRLIQVTYASDKVEDREIRGLIEGYRLTKAKELIIVTWDLEDVINVEGLTIKLIPLYKFLLTTESLAFQGEEKSVGT